jgi:hypothetical protein
MNDERIGRQVQSRTQETAMNTKLILASLIASFALGGATQASSDSKPYRCAFEILYTHHDGGGTRANLDSDDEYGDCAGPLK